MINQEKIDYLFANDMNVAQPEYEGDNNAKVIEGHVDIQKE